MRSEHDNMAKRFSDLPQPPVRFAINPEEITAIGNAACDHAQVVISKILSTQVPVEGFVEFEDVMGEILNLENEYQKTSNMMIIYAMTASDPKVKKAAGQMANKMNSFLDGLKADKKLFYLVDAVQKGEARRQRLRVEDKLRPFLAGTDISRDRESAKALAQEWRSHARKGVDLGLQEQVAERSKKIMELETEILEKLDGDPGALWFTREELVGLSPEVLAKLETRSGERGEELKILLRDPQVRWMESQLAAPETRSKLYQAARSRGKGHADLVHEVIQLRYEKALLLNYPSHTDYRVDSLMAKTPKAVKLLLDGIRDRVIQQLPHDLEKLAALKKTDTQAQPSTADSEMVFSSDIAYYTRLYEENNYSLDQNAIAEYFPLLPTVAKMLDLFGKLFGFAFSRIVNREIGVIEQTIPASELTWDDDVMLYSVWDDDKEGREFVGYLYLDLYARDGKAAGAMCRPLHLGYMGKDGLRHHPSTVLLTSFSKDYTLQHAEVTVLFHELGHGIHDLAGWCKYSRHHGAETASDFNEAPSQMLENWCWDPKALQALSGHRETGQPLPEHMIEAIVATRTVLPAVKLLQQLKVTLFDAAVHDAPEYEEGSEESGPAQIDLKRIWRECTTFDGIQDDGDEYGYTTNRNLLNGNDGTMYAYLWSKVLAQDMFETYFAVNTLDGEVGRRYRHEVLEKGGSQDEMTTFVEFMGRKPLFEAFYKMLGLES